MSDKKKAAKAPAKAKKAAPKKKAKAAKIPRKPGRPSKYSEAILAEICARLSVGEPLAAICRDEGMPSVTTVWTWGEDMDHVSESIARAREQGHDYLAAECLEIANTPMEGITTKTTDKGVEVTREDMLGHRKLQIDTRLKLLAKWNPKKYGDKLEVDNKGEITHTINFNR